MAVVTLCTALTFLVVLLRDGNLSYIWTLPDAMFYVAMARGHFDQVPAPFSARPLAPLAAHALATVLHSTVEHGFIVLAGASLLVALTVVFWLTTRTAAPRWTLLLLAAISFWPLLLTYAGLPDPLYTALLSLLLLALENDQLTFAAVLMFPLMLTRESTWLTLFCLIAVAWRGLRWQRIVLAFSVTALGASLVHHLAAGSLPNPEHLSGPLYMVGKLVSNTARTFGVVPWSNVYPELCPVPRWQHSFPFGPVRSVGVCSFASGASLIAAGSAATVFGVLLAIAIALFVARRVGFRQSAPVTRFCVLYGGISALLAPSLGTWFDRLYGYAWPLFLVAVPRLLASMPELTQAPGEPSRRSDLWALIAVVQVVLFAFSLPPIRPGILALAVVAQISVFAVLLGSLRRSAGTVPGS